MELDKEYFDSYDSIEVHNLMLRDEPRLKFYREAIMSSKNIFKDKVRKFFFSSLINKNF